MLDFRNSLNFKIVLVLLFVVVVNMVVSVLVWSLDFFVHGDLYLYGLVYSRDWGDPYWFGTWMLWVFLGGATAFAAVAAVVHYRHCREVTRFSKWTRQALELKRGGLFKWLRVLSPVFALAFEGISIIVFDQKSSIVWKTLINYWVPYDVEWGATYSLMSGPAVALMATAFFALVVPAVMAASAESR